MVPAARTLLWSALVAAALAAGCADTARLRDREVLDAAALDYGAGRFAAAEQKLNPLADPRRPLSAEAFYMRGMVRVRLAGAGAGAGGADALLAQAQADFGNALGLAAAGEGELIRLARLALGHCAFHRKTPDYTAAVRCYREALPPESQWLLLPEVDDNLYYLALAELRLGDRESATRHFNALLNRWPRGRYQTAARRHLAEAVAAGRPPAAGGPTAGAQPAPGSRPAAPTGGPRQP